MSTIQDLAAQIPAAVERLSGIVQRTPVQLNKRLSDATGCEIWLKREDLQPVRSYKLRGAYNLMSQLSAEDQARGVVCASAGNHGQGVAYSAAALGIQATVVVPHTTPRQKRERILAIGRGHINLVMHGTTYDEASEEASRLAADEGMTLVPAFNDPRTASGQATLLVEAFDQLGFIPDVVVLPVGGGGLVAGCAAWLRTNHPNVRIIGVEPETGNDAQRSLAEGRIVSIDVPRTIADGDSRSRAATRRMSTTLCWPSQSAHTTSAPGWCSAM